MNKKDIFSGIFLIIFSIIGIFLSLNIDHIETTSLPPYFFPVILFISIFICGLFLIISSIIKKENVEIPSFNFKKLIPVIILIIIYSYVYEYFGFILSTFFYVIITLFILGESKIIRTIFITSTITFSIYFVFTKVFMISL